MTTYTTRDEAIQREIIDPIEASGEVRDAHAEFDIEAIAEEALAGFDDGFQAKVSETEFWEAVQRHAR